MNVTQSNDMAKKNKNIKIEKPTKTAKLQNNYLLTEMRVTSRTYPIEDISATSKL